MSQLARITFVSLNGKAPGRDLDDIPEAECVFSIILKAFDRFCETPDAFRYWDGLGIVQAPDSGLHMVYVYGHAWLDEHGVRTSWSAIEPEGPCDGRQAVLAWVESDAASRTILVLDCCHAAAFGAYLDGGHAPLLVIFASAANESAISLVSEKASRLSLGLASEITRKTEVDLTQIAALVSEKLYRDTVIQGQTVSYRMAGHSFTLTSTASRNNLSRERIVARIRNRLIVIGSVATLFIGSAAVYYFTHVLLEIDLAGLSSISKDIRIVATVESPESNGSSKFADKPASGERVRIWAPARDVILRIQAQYVDSAERAVNFHLLLSPSFDPTSKMVALSLPPAAEIMGHPGMAYVPAVAWSHGRDKEPQRSEHAFWIELRPPTITVYTPVVERMLASRMLKQDNSFVLSARARNAAIDATGLGQIRELNKSLGDIMGVVAAANSDHVEAPGDIVVGAGSLPCKTCPAPMTRLEAGLYCEHRNMRLPTDLEWELAVRGVDGRDYPWGNKLDDKRANVPGLPQKAAPSPALKPVDAYAAERSPFGLIDTVGNAGDWVTNASGSYERVYMGATYRFNPEDATAWRMLPVTQEDALIREITARCVASNR